MKFACSFPIYSVVSRKICLFWAAAYLRDINLMCSKTKITSVDFNFNTVRSCEYQQYCAKVKWIVHIGRKI